MMPFFINCQEYSTLRISARTTLAITVASALSLSVSPSQHQALFCWDTGRLSRAILEGLLWELFCDLQSLEVVRQISLCFESFRVQG